MLNEIWTQDKIYFLIGTLKCLACQSLSILAPNYKAAHFVAGKVSFLCRNTPTNKSEGIFVATLIRLILC
jgi:hypothetical protein